MPAALDDAAPVGGAGSRDAAAACTAGLNSGDKHVETEGQIFGDGGG
jgi:hypothetical protein